MENKHNHLDVPIIGLLTIVVGIVTLTSVSSSYAYGKEIGNPLVYHLRVINPGELL